MSYAQDRFEAGVLKNRLSGILADGIKSVRFNEGVLEAVLAGLSVEELRFGEGLEFGEIAVHVNIGGNVSHFHFCIRRIVDDFSIAVSEVTTDSEERVLTMSHHLYHQDIEPCSAERLSELCGIVVAEQFQTVEF